MRGNCFESEQIWRSEIRADDGGSGGVIRIRACVGGWGCRALQGVGGGCRGRGGELSVCIKGFLGGVVVSARSVLLCVRVWRL